MRELRCLRTTSLKPEGGQQWQKPRRNYMPSLMRLPEMHENLERMSAVWGCNYPTPDAGSASGPGCSPLSGRWRAEISRLLGHFRVRLNSVEVLDCSTPDGHSIQALQLSQWTVNHVVCIQLPEVNCSGRDLTTCPGGWNDRAAWHSRFHLSEAVFRDSNTVATAERNNSEMKQMNRQFLQYYALFEVIFANVYSKSFTDKIALGKRLLKESKYSSQHNDMPEELYPSVAICHKLDKSVQQHQAQTSAQKIDRGMSFTSSPKHAIVPMNPAVAPAGTLAGYTEPAMMDLSAGRWRISAEERAKKLADGRTVCCGGLNHRVEVCAVRKIAQIFKVAGAPVNEVGTTSGPEELGKD